MPVAGNQRSLRRIPPHPQVLPITTASPGRLGLNLQQSQTVLPPEWATEAANAVIDFSGRIAARSPLNNITGTPVAGNPPIKTIFEHLSALGTTNQTIIAWDGGISNNLVNPSAGLISGTAPVSNGTWYFRNFIDASGNNKVIGFQPGQKIIVRNGAGNFATVVETAGTAPTGGVGTVAYGRVWQVAADGHTIMYCSLLDETKWGSGHGDAGQFDMANVWPQGTDTITAITAYNHTLIIFGTRQIVFLASPNASALGLDVTTLGVIDVIEGTGCYSQFTVQAIGDTDLVWLSQYGVQSMQRLMVQRSRPTTQLSKYVRDAILAQLTAETPQSPATVKSAYSPTQGFYALSFANSKYTWVFDLRFTWQDQEGDTICPVTRWTVGPTALFETVERNFYLSSLLGGAVAQYQLGTENGGTFNFQFSTPWMDLGSEYAVRLKALKRLGGIILSVGSVNVTFTYCTDFSPNCIAAGVVTSASGGSSEWGIAEWGIDEWSGGLLLQLLRVPAYTTGQYFQLSITASVTGQFAVQTSELVAKLGRIA
jgi:hypothetical protein